MLGRLFGTAYIEDLTRDYFCVSADLVSGRAVTHRSGPLVDAIGASMSLPGISQASRVEALAGIRLFERCSKKELALIAKLAKTIDVTPVVTASGEYSFTLTKANNNLLQLSSRQGANAPQLVVSFG